MTEQEIRELFKSKNVSLGRDDVWKVQQALVIKHAALERLGAEIGVKWEPPSILYAGKEEAVILASGRLGEAYEWSIGEASINVNYRVSGKQAAYVYAMAEKRAKDRVILKLAKLHGAYSEDEADDFKQPAQSSPVEVKRDDFGLPPVDDTSNRTLANALMETLKRSQTEAELDEWAKSNKAAVKGLPEDLRAEVIHAGSVHRSALQFKASRAA